LADNIFDGATHSTRTRAREASRQKALESIKAAGERDRRAHETWLRLAFPADYRRDASINVSATATTQQATVVCTEEQRRRLIELRERLLSQAPIGLPNQSKPDEHHRD